MAIRVRKLAKQVRRSPGEVLGLLHHLGYRNYTRVDDMVADTPSEKLRKAVRQGQSAPALAVEDRRVTEAVSSAREASSDLMAQLVPGVVRQGGEAPSSPPPARPQTVESGRVPRPPASASPPDAAVREGWDAERARWAAERTRWQGELDELRERCASLQASLDAVREVPMEGLSLGDLLQERGLLGTDEALRGLDALLAFRTGEAMLQARLAPAAAVRFQQTLHDLVLLDSAPPEELSVPAVVVAADRAEAPGGPTLDGLLRDLSEHMLLSGWRRLALVGIAPRWHEVVRARLDHRVDVSFQPAGEWSAAQVAALDADLVGAVGLRTPEHALSASSAVWVVERDIGAVLRRLVRLARGEDARS